MKAVWAQTHMGMGTYMKVYGSQTPSQINKNGLSCLLWGWYNTQTVGNALEGGVDGVEQGQKQTRKKKKGGANKAYATFASMIILNNSLPCTLG